MSPSKKFYFLIGLSGFNCSHSSKMMSRHEIEMVLVLLEGYKKLHIEESNVDAEIFCISHFFNGARLNFFCRTSNVTPWDDLQIVMHKNLSARGTTGHVPLNCVCMCCATKRK